MASAPTKAIFQLLWDKPEPLVPRHLRLDVTERLDAAGGVVTPLSEPEVKLACEVFREHEVDSIAICFLFSYLNDEHERQAAELVAEELPGVPLSVSSDPAAVARVRTHVYDRCGCAREAGNGSPSSRTSTSCSS